MNKKLASSTLDFYDDPSLLKDLFESVDEIPEVIKQAEYPTNNYDFALIDDGVKRYPVNDQGNFLLSVYYFDKLGHTLPQELYKEAMFNLMENITRFKSPVPESFNGAVERLKAKGVELRTREKDWKDELSLDRVVDNEGYSDAGKPLTYIRSPESTKEIGPFDKKIEDDKKGKETEKLALNKYPLNTYTNVKTASDYFDKYHTHFSPQDRVEFATELYKRADELCLKVSTITAKYAGTSYDPMFKYYTDMRKEYLVPEEHYVIDELVKNAQTVSPHTFAEALEIFDREYNLDQFWDQIIPDPYYSTLGAQEKTAEEDTWRYHYRDVLITKDHLKKLSTKYHNLKEMFGPTLAEDIIRDPVKTFERLDKDRKYILARYAFGETIQ